MTVFRDIGLAIGCLREDAPRAAARVAWTFASAFGLFSCVCILTWIAIHLFWRVRDDHVGIGLLCAALIWLGALWLVWRPYRDCRPVLAAILTTGACVVIPILAVLSADVLRMGRSVERGAAAILGTAGAIVTLRVWTRYLRGLEGQTSRLARAGRYRAASHSIATVIVTVGVGFLADEFGGRDSEFLVAGATFLGAAALLLAWVPTMARAHRQRLMDANEQLNVHCPSCGYSLIGLRELRCPECGTQFTLDELIRAQEYDLDPRQREVLPGQAAAADR